jgi:hypothetical protein
MNYRLEWIGGVVVFGTVLLLLIVPEFAVIAVLVVALAALVAIVALIAAVLVSPYLLVRGVRRRLAQRTTRRRTGWIHLPSAILGVARSLRRQTGRREPTLRSAAVHREATEDPHRSGT